MTLWFNLCEWQHLLQSDLAITDPALTETLLYRTLFKALPSQSHLSITDKLKSWWSRYNGNLVFQVRYSKVRLYVLLEVQH